MRRQSIWFTIKFQSSGVLSFLVFLTLFLYGAYVYLFFFFSSESCITFWRSAVASSCVFLFFFFSTIRLFFFCVCLFSQRNFAMLEKKKKERVKSKGCPRLVSFIYVCVCVGLCSSCFFPPVLRVCFYRLLARQRGVSDEAESRVLAVPYRLSSCFFLLFCFRPAKHA